MRSDTCCRYGAARGVDLAPSKASKKATRKQSKTCKKIDRQRSNIGRKVRWEQSELRKEVEPDESSDILVLDLIQEARLNIDINFDPTIEYIMLKAFALRYAYTAGLTDNDLHRMESQ